ncbi:MAG: HD domain-containing phosphohydrolase [Lachnospiraceae bacterium]
MQEILPIAYGVIMIISMGFLLLLAWQKPGREQQIMQWVATYIMIMMLGYWIRSEADTIGELITAQRLIYLAGCFLYYYMFLFFLKYCHVDIPVRCQHILGIMSCILMLLTVTFDRHNLLYRSYEAKMQDGVYYLDKEYGPLHTIYILTMGLYLLAMFVITVRYLGKSSGHRRMQGVLLLFVVLCPTVAYAAEKILDLPYDLIPFGVLLGELLMMYLMYIDKLYDFNDTAREMVYSGADMALIAVDTYGRYKGCNSLALKIFPELLYAVTDMEAAAASDKLSPMLSGTLKELNYQGKIYEVEQKEVLNKKKNVGTVIWLTDVTEQREHLKFLENYQQKLESEVERKTEHIQSLQEKMLLGLADIIENRDNNTGGHVKRTRDVVDILVNTIKESSDIQVSEYFCKSVVRAASMHDIGKINIDDRILRKPGKFTEEEFTIMKGHSVKSEEIVTAVLDGIEDPEFVQIARNIARYHHERWDGSGYPDHLCGEQIPLEARIMALADVYDALVSERCYKKPMSFAQAGEIIVTSMGKHFDPRLNDVFLTCRPRLEAYYSSQS